MGKLSQWWNSLWAPETARSTGKWFVLVTHLDVNDKLTRTGFYLYCSPGEKPDRCMSRWAQSGFDFGLYYLSDGRYILRERVKEIRFTYEDLDV